MAIVPKFTPSTVMKQLQDKLANIEEAIIRRLTFVGEKFVTNARNNHTYKDQTGNLTASIGYVILKDGEQINGDFPGTKAVGKAAGERVAADVATKFPNGIVLIVVAGMEYAAAVESRNLDVLTASSFQAESDLKKAISELKGKIK